MARSLPVAALMLAACTPFASKSDYADYRKVRLADNERQRAVAMGEYVRSNPDGMWAQELGKKRNEAEPLLYESAKSTRDGLRFYLEAYPDGQFVAQAKQRLQALQQVAGNREDQQEAEREVRREQREELVQRRQTWATRAIGFWVETLLGIGNWGQPIANVAKNNPDFNKAFGKNPRPHCSRAECIKFYQLQFAIPVPGSTRIDRTLKLLLRLRLSEGKLTRAEILIPNKGFSRWYELQNETLVTDEDPTQRNEAINWAVDKITPVVKKVASNVEPFDIVPDPVDPPKVQAPNQPDPGASQLPGAEAPAEGEGEPQDAESAQAEQSDQSDDESEERPQSDSEMDRLLDEAAPVDEGEGDEGDAEQEAEPEPAETMKLPIAVQGYRTDQLKVGIFAASPDDYGRAYDGLFIELTSGQGEGGAADDNTTDGDAENGDG